MRKKSLPRGKFLSPRFLYRSRKRPAKKILVCILVQFSKRVFLAALKAADVVESIRLTKRSVVKKVVANPHIRHRSLWRNRLHRRMGINAGFRGQKPGIRNSQ